jgi:hypothetical protein
MPAQLPYLNVPYQRGKSRAEGGIIGEFWEDIYVKCGVAHSGDSVKSGPDWLHTLEDKSNRGGKNREASIYHTGAQLSSSNPTNQRISALHNAVGFDEDEEDGREEAYLLSAQTNLSGTVDNQWEGGS